MEEKFNNMQLMLEKLISYASQTTNQQEGTVISKLFLSSGMLKTA